MNKQVRPAFPKPDTFRGDLLHRKPDKEGRRRFHQGAETVCL